MTTEFYKEHLKQIQSSLDFILSGDKKMSYNSKQILTKESNKIKRILQASDFRNVLKYLK